MSGSQGRPVDLSRLPRRTYYLVAFWVESNIYGAQATLPPDRLRVEEDLGVYFLLYFATVKVYRRKKAQDTTASRISMVGNTLLFLLTTFHNSINVYRMLQAYVMQPLDAGIMAPVTYLEDFSNWDAYTYALILPLVTWTADLLVMYRCWIVWQRNNWVLVVPILLLLASFAATSMNLHYFRTRSIPREIIIPVLQTSFPINFAQNTLTTGLIAYRIWRQHRTSSNAGIEIKSGLTLFTVMRIIIESASVYTLTMLVMIVLSALRHPALVIVQHASIPLTAIVFVLISIRAHVAKHSSETTHYVDTSTPWVPNDRPPSDASMSVESGESLSPTATLELEGFKRPSLGAGSGATNRIHLPQLRRPSETV